MNNRRVHYREHQRLRAADLQAEQNERRNARRRHNLGQHAWGIVYGLALVYENGLLLVQPGLALDGYGRELLVPQPMTVSQADLIAAFDDAGLVRADDSADVWLTLLPMLDSSGSRWQDTVALRLTAANEVQPRQPPGVPEEDQDFETWRALPDDPYPVCLGQVTRNAGDTFTMEPAYRVYAGLVGVDVFTPKGDARLHLDDAPRGRFTLELFGQEVFRLAHEYDTTRATLRGDVRLDVDEAAVTAVSALAGIPRHRMQGISYPAVMPQPEAALPWSLYRTQMPVLGPDGAPTDDPPVDQLRLEMFDPGSDGNPALQRLAIGVSSEAGFRPCLVVRSNCEVEVFGDVYIEGEGVEMPIPADPSDLRFQDALLNTWQTGMVAGDERIVPTPVLDVTILLDPTSGLVVGSTVRYQVQVRNTSQSPVSTVRVLGHYVNTNGSGSAAVTLLAMPELSAGGTTPVSDTQSIIPPVPGQLRITATAFAFAADGAMVRQEATLTLTIGPGIN